MQPFYEDKKERFECFLSKNITFPAHLHSAAEMIFILEGALEVTIGDQSEVIHKHEVAFAFPDVIHSYLCTKSCLAILCIFSTAHAKEYYHQLRKQQPMFPFFYSCACNPDIPFAFDRMLQNMQQSTTISIAWLNLILAYLIPETVMISRNLQGNTDISYQLISYVSMHFQEPLSLDRLAKELHFNKFYISRVFTEKLHCGFYQYINRLRLDYAARQLKDTDHSITEIWQDAGFESQKTFNRTFLACYRMTPSQYRKVLPPIS